MKICLEAAGDDGGLLALGPGQLQVHGVQEPGQEVHWVALGLDGELLLAGSHHRLHELVRADLPQQPHSALGSNQYAAMFKQAPFHLGLLYIANTPTSGIIAIIETLQGREQ